MKKAKIDVTKASKKKEQRRFDKSYHEGYHIMPAAVDFFSLNEQMGVKFETNPRSKWYEQDSKDATIKYYYPDRTIYRSKPGVVHAAIADTELDQILEYAPLGNPELYTKMGYKYAMISSPHMGFKHAPLRNPHLRLFADSGGFQLRQGVTDFVDPDQLIPFYNATTDIGIGLDIPLHPLLYDDYLARMAEITARNNQYIKSKLNPNVALYDLNHGMDLRDRKIFFDAIEKYPMNDGIALAGTSSKARGEYGVSAHIINGVVGIAYTLDRAAKHYKTAHILGTTTPFYMFVFHVMTKSGFFKHITSDSSTYAQAAMMNTMLTSVPGNSLLYRNGLPKGKVLWRTPCACPVCSMVGYSQHLQVNARANMVHSLYHFAFLDQLLSDLADQYVRGLIKESEVEKIVSPSAFNAREFQGTMRFVRDLSAHGFSKAYANSKNFIEPLIGRTNTKSLFGVKKKVNMAHADEDRANRILSSYEKWQAERGLYKGKVGGKK